MKYIFIFLIIVSSIGFAYQRDGTIFIQPQPYVYPDYQPDNGPMRGPNSLEAHKYGYDEWLRRRNYDYNYRENRNDPRYYNNYDY